MTAPSTLTPAQLAKIKAITTPAAFAYNEYELPDEAMVDPAQSYLVHQDVRMVAVDILEAAAAYAEGAGAESSSAELKRVRIDGELEIERFQATSSAQINAAAWWARARRLRDEIAGGGVPGLLKSPVARMTAGGGTEPVFTITRPRIIR